MTVWATLTDVQADAVHATAVLHLRDPGELAAELAPLLQDRAVVFEGNSVAEPVWTLLGTTESGSGLYVRPVGPSEIPVNDLLTLLIGAP